MIEVFEYLGLFYEWFRLGMWRVSRFSLRSGQLVCVMIVIVSGVFVRGQGSRRCNTGAIGLGYNVPGTSKWKYLSTFLALANQMAP